MKHLFTLHAIYKNPVAFDINLTEIYQNYWIFFHKYAKIIKVYMTKFIKVLSVSLSFMTDVCEF